MAERFELFVHGMELANAYTELNDPLLQEALFRKQLAGQKEEDSMAKMDDDFVRALKHAMPPAGGLGIGIDRLCMLLLNQSSIRDVILFPLMRPAGHLNRLAACRVRTSPIARVRSTEGVAVLYKYLLCWRYLRTRYIALASIVSVLLGVATMIVVNSVMAGFSEKMRDRLHGVLADVVVESYDLDGFFDSDEVMARIKSVAGDAGRGDGPDHRDVRPDEVPVRRPVDHPPGADHRHPPRGACPDRRLRRVPHRRQARYDGNDHRIPPSFEIPEIGQAEHARREACWGETTRQTS